MGIQGRRLMDLYQGKPSMWALTGLPSGRRRLETGAGQVRRRPGSGAVCMGGRRGLPGQAV